ncbi:IS3 family transposase [Brucella sp. 10RB9210]|nr:IS3 family transposase [Brucella sp. 10RB9210]
MKEATVKQCHCNSHAQLKAHLHDFINAYNYGSRQKTLRGLTLYEYIRKIWATEPQRFKLNPHHQRL